MLKRVVFIYATCNLFFSCASLPSKPLGEEGKIEIMMGKIKSSDKQEILKAIDFLGEAGAGKEDVKEELMLLFTSRDKDIKFSALRSLQNLVQKEALLVYIKDTSHKNTKRRRLAIGSFAFVNDSYYEQFKLHTLLKDALKDKDKNVRLVAINVIAAKKEWRVTSELASLLLTDKEIASYEIVHALLNIGRQATPVLLEKLTDPKWKDVVPSLTVALFAIGKSVADDILLLFGNADRHVKFEILKQMSKVLDKRGGRSAPE